MRRNYLVLLLTIQYMSWLLSLTAITVGFAYKLNTCKPQHRVKRSFKLSKYTLQRYTVIFVS